MVARFRVAVDRQPACTEYSSVHAESAARQPTGPGDGGLEWGDAGWDGMVELGWGGASWSNLCLGSWGGSVCFELVWFGLVFVCAVGLG